MRVEIGSGKQKTAINSEISGFIYKSRVVSKKLIFSSISLKSQKCVFSCFSHINRPKIFYRAPESGGCEPRLECRRNPYEKFKKVHFFVFSSKSAWTPVLFDGFVKSSENRSENCLGIEKWGLLRVRIEKVRFIEVQTQETGLGAASELKSRVRTVFSCL